MSRFSLKLFSTEYNISLNDTITHCRTRYKVNLFGEKAGSVFCPFIWFRNPLHQHILAIRNTPRYIELVICVNESISDEDWQGCVGLRQFSIASTHRRKVGGGPVHRNTPGPLHKSPCVRPDENTHRDSCQTHVPSHQVAIILDLFSFS